MVASAAAAQSSSTSTRQVNFEIVSVDGNNVVWRDDKGQTREYKAPDGFKVMVDGHEMAVPDLKPGMKGVATVKTTTTMHPVTVTEVKNGQVMATAGNAVIVRMADGTMRQFTQADVEKRHAKLYRQDQEVALSAFRPGDMLSATIVTDGPPKIMTEQQVASATAKSAPKPAAAPAPAAASAPAAAPAASAPAPAAEPAAAPMATHHKLPKTASPLPAVGIFGALFLAAGLGLTLRRTRVAR
jgi:hypothetical protein